jgi:hypothetical protein
MTADLVILGRQVLTRQGIRPARVRIDGGRIGEVAELADGRLGGDWLAGDWLGGDWLAGDWLAGERLADSRLGGDRCGGDRCGGDRRGGDRLAADRLAGERLAGERTGLVVLADDEVLLPGLVDTHVHVNEPGRTEWEGFATATAAAAAGGVTTILDMPLNSVPPTVDVAALAAKRAAAAGQCAVDVGFWGGAVPGNAGERRALHEAGVFGFKCFMVDSGVPEFPPLDDAGLAEASRQVAEFGCVSGSGSAGRPAVRGLLGVSPGAG